MMLLKPDDTQVITWFIIGVFSAWGGVVRYLLKVAGHRTRHRWPGIISQVIVSAFTGVLGGLLVFEAGGSNYMSFIVSGLFGSLGGGSLDYLYSRFLPGKENK